MEANDRKNSVKDAIAGAIVFFDLLDYPLTGQEIWKNMFTGSDFPDGGYSLADVLAALDESVSLKEYEIENGFYFLPGRKDIVSRRMESLALAPGKFGTAISACRWLRVIPGVRMIAVCNSLAMGNIKEGSDIDLFIAIGSGRLWLTRSFATLAVKLLGMRGYDKKNRICLSFYVSQEGLDLQKIALPKDPYLYFWIASILPVYDDGFYSKFYSENQWVRRYLPNFEPVIPHSRRTVGNGFFLKTFKKINGFWLDSFLGEKLEHLARLLQNKMISDEIKKIEREKDTRVIFSDTMLKFHETDKREEYRDKWIKKTNEIHG